MKPRLTFELSQPGISISRTALAWSIGVIATGLIALSSILCYLITRSERLVQLHGRAWGRFLLWLMGTPVTIAGLYNIPRDHHVILMSNHQSWCDIFAYAGYIPIPFKWIAKRELFRIPLVGLAMKAAGYIPIDRQNRESAFETIEGTSNQLKQESILIFPEGTRTRTGKLGRFKHGIVYLALQSQAPIITMMIQNSFDRMPPGRIGVSPGTIHIDITPEIQTKGLDKTQLIELIDTIRSDMQIRLGETAAS